MSRTCLPHRLGKRNKRRLAVWWALYAEVPVGDDPEWDNAVKTILERIATKQRLETLQ
jgi:hypothetical protein